MSFIDCIVKSKLISKEEFDTKIDALKQKIEDYTKVYKGDVIAAEARMKHEFIKDQYESLNKELNSIKEKVGIKQSKVSVLPFPNFKEINKKYEAEKLKSQTPITETPVQKKQTLSESSKQKMADAKKTYAEAGKLDSATDARGLALEYFAGGGKLRPDEIANEVTGKSGSLIQRRSGNKTGEVKARDYVDAKGKTIDQITHSIWDNLPENLQQTISDRDIKNEVISVVSEHSKRLDFANELVKRNYDEAVVQHLTEEEANNISEGLKQDILTHVEGLPEEQQAGIIAILDKYQNQYGMIDWKKLEEDSNGFNADILSLPKETSKALDAIIEKNNATGQSEHSITANESGSTPDKKGKSNEQKATEELISRQSEEIRIAKESLSDKRKELDKTLIADQENLFGERASNAKPKLFDERVSASEREKALQPFKDRVTKAENELERLHKVLANYEGKASAQLEIQQAFKDNKFQVGESESVKLSKMKEIVGDLIDEGITELKDIQDIAARELKNNSPELKQLVSDAYDKASFQKSPEVQTVLAKRINAFVAKIFGKPQGDKSIAVLKNSDAMMAKAKEIENAQFQVDDIYHGSPHSFDKFSLDKIGTGEGAQAFGHGLYFTDVKGIAEGYAENILQQRSQIDWANKVRDNYDKFPDLNFKSPHFRTAIVDFLTGNAKSLQRVEDLLMMNMPNTKKGVWAEDGSISNESKESLKKVQKFTDYLKQVKEESKKSRNLYKVSLHEGKTAEQYDWLVWDSNISDAQLNKIKKGLDKLGVEYKISGIDGVGRVIQPKGTEANLRFKTGSDVYSAIKNLLRTDKNNIGTPKEASDFLLSTGIDGVKYPAESIARAANSDNARGFNYVVFDDKAVTVKEKIQFQKNDKGEILGFTDPSTGKIYLNGEHLNPNTPIHEAGHIWTEWAKQQPDKKLYNRGIELITPSKYLADVSKNEFYKTEALKAGKEGSKGYIEYMQHEALAKAIGDNGEKFITEARKNSFKEWAKNLWNKIATAAGFKDITADELRNMTLDEFSKRATVDILKGGEEVKAEEPPIKPPIKPPIDNGGNVTGNNEDGVGISKQAIFDKYGKSFEKTKVGWNEVTQNALDRLRTDAEDKNTTIEQEAQSQVFSMANEIDKNRLSVSEDRITTATFHLINTEEKIDNLQNQKATTPEERSALAAQIDLAIGERDLTLKVLDALGSKSGRNLGLFAGLFSKTNDGGIRITQRRIEGALGIEIPSTEKELDENKKMSEWEKNRVRPYVKKLEQIKADYDAKIKELEKNKSSEESVKKERKKTSDNIRSFADKIRNSTSLDKLGLGGSVIKGADVAGFSINIKEHLADALDFIADGIDKGEELVKLIAEAAGKFKGKNDEEEFKNLINLAAGKLPPIDKSIVGGIVPFDVKQDAVSEAIESQRKKTIGQLNQLTRLAEDSNRKWYSKGLDWRRSFLIGGIKTLGRVAISGVSKFVVDPIAKQTTGRIAGLLPGLGSKTSFIKALKAQGEGVGSLIKFTDNKSALKYVNDKLTAFDKASQDLQKGNDKLESLKSNPNAYKKYELTEYRKLVSDYKKAELENGKAAIYKWINGNGFKDSIDLFKYGSTDFEQAMGGYSKIHVDELGKSDKVLYYVESINRLHSVLKNPSARRALVETYNSRLDSYQKQGIPLNASARMRALDIAYGEFLSGKYQDRSQLTDLVNRQKQLGDTKNASTVEKIYSNFLKLALPVAKIGINIVKSGVDMSTIGVEGLIKYGYEVNKGIKLNADQHKEYANVYQKLIDGANAIPEKEKLYINKVLSRGLFGLGLMASAAFMVSNGTIQYGGEYDPDHKSTRKYKDKHGNWHSLDYGEWVIEGVSMGKFGSGILNHLPEFLPVAMVVNSHTVYQYEKEYKGTKGRRQLKDTPDAFYETFKSDINEISERLPFKNILEPAQLAKSLVSLPIASNISEYFDKDAKGNLIERKPKNFLQNVELNTGFRKLVPLKK